MIESPTVSSPNFIRSISSSLHHDMDMIHNELGRNYSLPINSHHFAMGPETERDATMAVNAITWLLLL